MSDPAIPAKRKHEDSDTDAPATKPDGEQDLLEHSEENLSYGKWMRKIDTALEQGTNVEDTFDKYLAIFRNDGKTWAKYIDYEMDHGLDKKKIEVQFSKILKEIFDVNLWRMYVKYVQRINPATGENAEMARSIVLKAFNFAADNVGIDFLGAQPFWNDYIRYLNEWKPQSANEGETRIELTRQVMHKMIQYPSKNLEENWKIYTNFENETNQARARKNINDKSAEFMKLRPISQELYAITKPLKESDERRHTKRQLEHVAQWIRWEQANKLKLAPDQVQQRVNYVYRQSTEFLRFQPEVWYNYAAYLFAEHKDDDAFKLLQDGLLMNPESLVLTYQLASYYEQVPDIEKVRQVWLKLISYLSYSYEHKKDKEYYGRAVSSCYTFLMKQVKRIGSITDVRSVFGLARKFAGISWQVFVDYAVIEYQSNDIRVTLRSFELAMKYFGANYDFVSAYLDFLISIKDMTNCKKVVETAVSNLKDDKASLLKLYQRYLKIEIEFGDSNSIKRLEKRFIEAFPDRTPFDLTVTGFKSDFDTFNPSRRLDQYIADTDVVEETIEKSVTFEDDAPVETVKEEEEKKKPFVVGDEVYNLLRVLPRAEYYDDKPVLFDTAKTVEFFADVKL